jgi:opacity protein-like surface antigen
MKQLLFAMLMFLLLSGNASAQQTQNNTKEKVKWILSVNGGYGTRTARLDPEVPSSLKEHIRKLRTGPVLQLEAGIKASNAHAFTLSFSSLMMENNNHVYAQSSVVQTPGGPTTVLTTNRISTNDRINVITANWVSFSSLNPNQTVFLTSKLGMGIASYRSENSIQVINFGTTGFELNGTGFAILGGLGLDIKLSKSLFLSLNGELTTASAKLKSGNEASSPADEKEGLSNLNFTGGIRLVL